MEILLFPLKETCKQSKVNIRGKNFEIVKRSFYHFLFISTKCKYAGDSLSSNGLWGISQIQQQEFTTKTSQVIDLITVCDKFEYNVVHT